MMEHLDIICIGESLVELSADKSISQADFFNKYYGGDSITTAVTAAILGSKTGYITRIGNDYFKDFLLDSWQSAGIDISSVKLIDGTNGLYFISIKENNEKEFTYYRKKTAGTYLSIDDIDPDYIGAAKIVYSPGTTQSLSVTAKDAVKKAFEIAKEKSIKVAYDPNVNRKLWRTDEASAAFEEVVEYVDILLLNSEHDAEPLIGTNSPDKTIKYYWDRGISHVIVKSGGKGTYVGYNGDISFVPAISTTLVDATCAGDAFNGAYLHGIVSGYSPVESAKLGTIVAAYQVQGIGAIKSLPTRDYVYNQFKNKENI